MAKYSFEFKLKVVQDYLDGPKGYKLLAKKYQIPDESSIQNWVRNYNEYGVEGLTIRPTPNVYTVQFKLNVLQFMQRTGASYRDTAVKFGMRNHSPIMRWKRDFESEGIEGLKPKRKESASMSKNKVDNQNSNQAELSKIKELEQEIELYQLEIAYLKKLRAFQESPNAYLEKHKQCWHSNSKKKDID